MKPTKNRVYCIDANKAKMVFESKKKALNFIRFNAEEMMNEGKKVPVRAYYCSACGGWHLTSNPNEEAFEYGSRLEMMIAKRLKLQERLKQERQREQQVMAVQKVYDEAVELFAQGDYKATVKKVKSFLTQLESIGGDKASFALGYKLLYNIVCVLIPEMFALIDTDDFCTAQALYGRCQNICGIIGDVEGFEDYKSTVGEYLQEAGEAIACHQRMATWKKKLALIMAGTEAVDKMIAQGLYCDAEYEISKYAQELQEFVGNMDVYDMACEAVGKLYTARLMLNKLAA